MRDVRKLAGRHKAQEVAYVQDGGYVLAHESERTPPKRASSAVPLLEPSSLLYELPSIGQPMQLFQSNHVETGTSDALERLPDGAWTLAFVCSLMKTSQNLGVVVIPRCAMEG